MIKNREPVCQEKTESQGTMEISRTWLIPSEKWEDIDSLRRGSWKSDSIHTEFLWLLSADLTD